MPEPYPPLLSEITLLTQDPLSTGAPLPSSGWETWPGGAELYRRVSACYAELRAKRQRVRCALQRKLALPLVGMALLLALGQEPSQAATTWTVCASGCNYTSIKAAIAAPTTLDGDTLAIAAGTYTEPGITVNKSLTLQGAGAASTRVQAAASQSAAKDRVFTIVSGVTVTLQDLTIRYGRVPSNPSDGGGLHNDGTLTLTHSTVSGNTARWGGGLANNGTLTLINSTLSGNSARWGGGLANWWMVTLTHSTVSANTAEHDGGGLNNDGTLTLTHSTVSGNTAGFVGGGLNNNRTVTLINSTVSGNTATEYDGGGLYNDGTLTLINSTLSGNSARWGGGLANHGALTLTNSTVSGNTATEYDGGGLSNVGTLTVTNSIVARNPIGGDCYDFWGSIISEGSNLDSDGSCELTAPTDRPGVDPLLGPLQDNGGPTVTHALLPGSPAIDAIPWDTNGCGTYLISDQRSQARPQPAGGACDIGAFEVEVAGQPLSGWVTGFTPESVRCKNVTTGQVITRSEPALMWNCEAAGIVVTLGDHIAMRVRGTVDKGATIVGGAVMGVRPTSGGCTNLTTGETAQFRGMQGATAGDCVAAGLIVHPGDLIQMQVQGVAE